MPVYTSTPGVGGLLPESYGPLIDAPVAELSAAFRVSSVVETGSTEFHVPVLTEDPSAAWVAEGAEIPPDDAVFAEIVVVPRKVAGLSIISRELAEDSNPQAATIIGRGLARDIAKKIDQAFFGSLSLPAPPGLGSLTNVSVATRTDAASLDVFAEALSIVEQHVIGDVTFVLSPADALALSTLKDEAGSARPLLGLTAANGTDRQILGVRTIVSPELTTGTGWLLPAGRIHVVRRNDTRVERSTDAFFTSDRVAIKATSRVGFGFSSQASLVRLDLDV